MSNYLQMLQMNQELTTLVMVTAAINLGLILVILIVGAMNQIRTNQIMNRVLTLENRILARLQETSMEVMMEGTPVVLEDLIKRDLMEQMEQNPELNAPVTEEELMKIRQEMTQGIKKS